jgi:sugar/nucleoside kinase (ribokinase family)
MDGVGRVHVSGYTLFAQPGLELVRLVTRAALDRGAEISVDPASTGFLREFGPERFLRETAAATTIIPNRDEALLLTGAPDAATAAEALSTRYGTAAVKLGPGGALLAVGGTIVHRSPGPARPAGDEEAVIDSTGAGDAFAAGLLTALLGGAEMREAVDAGCRAGAVAVTRVGGRPVEANRTVGAHGARGAAGV